MFFLRSSVMVRPFHSASTRLLASSASLALQSMGLNSTSTPMRWAAARAMSMSKPTSSLCSLRKPMGGKLSSRPTTILVTATGAGAASGAAAVGAGGSVLPQAASKAVRASEASRVRLFIEVLFPKNGDASQMQNPRLCRETHTTTAAHTRGTIRAFCAAAMTTAPAPTPAPRTTPPPMVAHHPCPECAGPLEWSAKAQQLQCPYCGTQVPWQQEQPPGAQQAIIEHDLAQALEQIGRASCRERV